MMPLPGDLEGEPLPDEYALFWRLWEQGEYFECHEVLEEAWRRETNSVRKQFFQGLIHCAVALVHVGRQNKVGASLQLEKANAKLSSLGSVYCGCDIITVLEFVEKKLADHFKASANVGEIL